MEICFSQRTLVKLFFPVVANFGENLVWCSSQQCRSQQRCLLKGLMSKPWREIADVHMLVSKFAGTARSIVRATLREMRYLGVFPSWDLLRR